MKLRWVGEDEVEVGVGAGQVEFVVCRVDVERLDEDDV